MFKKTLLALGLVGLAAVSYADNQPVVDNTKSSEFTDDRWYIAQ